MSAGRTVITPTVPKDRVISKFPQAFHADASPYQKLNFHPKVKSACSEHRTGTVGLKICKAVLVGDVAVGKTSFVNRFCHDIFDRDYKATIGVDFEVEKFSILGIPFTLQIWDTAGQERFKCIAASYYRGANVVMVVFDLTDEVSLANASRWMESATENATNPVRFLVGTKRDLLSEAAYTEVESHAVKVANELEAEFWGVSSKTGDNVVNFFFRAAALTFDAAVLREVESGPSHPRQIGNDLVKVQKQESQDLYDRGSKKSLKCCN
ncbi:ras-related protein Rab-34-like [Liolophura sinensis]|uniref:ras-related protein Rab-34-like n=1 Tax=Liolophura sinensis TaxID=3198878 RepID=UPI00315954BC